MSGTYDASACPPPKPGSGRPSDRGGKSAEAAMEVARWVEEAVGGPGVRVPVIRDPTAFRVDPEPIGVPIGRDPFEVREELALELGFGETVGSPDDHRGSTHHAVGDPALLVLEMPLGHPFGAAEEAVVAHPFGLIRSGP